MKSHDDTPPTNDSEAMSLRALLILERDHPEELTELEKARLFAMRQPKQAEPLEVSMRHLLVLLENVARSTPRPLRWIILLRIRMLRRKLDRAVATAQRNHPRLVAVPATSTAQEHAADDHHA